MNTIKSMFNLTRLTMTTALLAATTLTQAATSDISLCVYDPTGSNGDIMSIAKDYALEAGKWGVTVKPQVYTTIAATKLAFEGKQCNGIIADNYTARPYNTFMGTVGAIGAVQNYDVAQQIFYALASPKLANALQSKNYEVVGYIPFGLAYMFTKDRAINSLQKISGKNVGVLDSDPSQKRMAQKVGANPIMMTLDSADNLFKSGRIDVLPSPLMVYRPFEIAKIIGTKGGIANYPIAFSTMNVIINKGNYPSDFGQKSRQWFSKRSPEFFNMVKRWESTVPRSAMYEIPSVDRSGYDLLLSQMRKEFVNNRTYDPAMMVLITSLRCHKDPSLIDCKK